MKLAAEFNRYFTSMNGVDVPLRVSVPRDEWRVLFEALATQPATSAAKGAIMGAAYDFRDAHLSGSTNLKRSAHAELESAVDAALAEQPEPVLPNGMTNELHVAIAKMQVLMREAADRIEENKNSLAESSSLNGIIKDLEVQAMVESDTLLVAHLRAAALPWDQRHKHAEQPAQQEPINESTDLLQWREAMDDKETPPAQRNQLTKQERDLIHAATGSMTFFKAVDYAISQTEAAHNIKDHPRKPPFFLLAPTLPGT